MSYGAASTESATAFRPVKVVELELGAPLAPEEEGGWDRYGRALVIVLLHGIPLGQVKLELAGKPPSPGELAAAVWQALAEPISEHLRADGLHAPESLDAAGIPGEADPPCSRSRRAFLAGDPPRLDVIIPTRERSDRLRRCLDSILSCEYPRDRRRILVVDNAPATDQTERLLEDSFRGEVEYLCERVPGSASARNAGVQASGSPIVVFTDDDVVVDRWWLAEIARTYGEVPEADSVNGLLLPLELETPAQVWFEEYGGFSRGYERRVFDLDRHRPDHPLFPFNAGVFGTANSMSYRRAVLESLGGFDPALGNGTPARGGVDTEIVLRTILHGHTIVYQPTALAYHSHRREYEALHRQVYAYGVGLTATYTKTLVANPRLLPEFLRKVPRGLTFAVHPRSSKNAGKTSGYPSALTRAELRGMAYGPLAYLRSRRLQRKGTGRMRRHA
jgi:glycosyltransferase involved in cell wall biosynthesis